MQAFREKNRIVLSLGRNESNLLQRILLGLKKEYETPPSKTDKATGESWYSTRGCLSAGMNAEQTMEWIEQLHQFRRSNLPILTKILAALHSREKDQDAAVRLAFDEAQSFLAILNDHRLLAAARHEIGEQEISVDFFDAVRGLEPEQQMALCEIDLLALVMESVLQALPGSGSDWRRHLSDEDLSL